ncbi:MAG: hypothetical protein ABIK09_06320 [Pseudomonadota bacterium]
MRTLAPTMTLVLMLSLGAAEVLAQPKAPRPLKLKFQTADAVNLLWMIDQMSRWDPKTAALSYRDYWEKKIGLTEEDLDMLERYARMRRRLSSAGDKDGGNDLDLLGGGASSARDQYFLTFLEMPGLADALKFLPVDVKDKETILAVLKHFGKKIGTQGNWKEETEHLKSFETQANVLASFSSPTPSAFITQVRVFLGIETMPEQITVSALWAPPGSTDARPAILNSHVILPLPVEAVQNDEAVVRQMAIAVGVASRYMIGKLPEAQRRYTSQRILAGAGLVNPERPTLLLDALATSLGQVLFLKEVFPDLATGLTLAPFEPSLPYPYAVDELARALVPDLKSFLPTPGAFGGSFMDMALQKMDQLYPPRFSALASVTAILGQEDSASLFRATFTGSWQVTFSLEAVDGFVQFLKDNRRPSVILINPKQAGQMNLALKKLGMQSKQLPNLRQYRGKSVIYPLTVGKGYGPMVVIIAQQPDDFRKAFVELHRLQGLPTKPMIVSNAGTN